MLELQQLRGGSVVAVPGLSSTRSMVVAHRLSWSMACGIFPDRDKLMFPALAGRFFTIEPPGKPQDESILNLLWQELKMSLFAQKHGGLDILCSTVQQHPSPRTVQEHHHLTRRCPVPVGCLRALVLSRKWSFHCLLYQGFFKKITLFACLFYFWLCWVCFAAGLLTSRGARASHCSGFSRPFVLEHRL